MESIPVIGRLIDEILNLVQELIARVVGVFDIIIGAFGIRPLKKMRLCIIILKDENGVTTTTEAALQPFIQAAQSIFLDEANIQVVVDGIHVVSEPSPGYGLDVGCNETAWGEDLLLTGSYFQFMSLSYCSRGATGRVLGLSPQIVVFCVRNIPGTTAGCALGPVTDYLTIEGGNPVCLAHEIGHKVGLWHCCAGTNLANGTCGGTLLEDWQVLIARTSKYVTYV